MPRPVHFEIHSSDPEAAITFYEQLFGWRFQSFGGGGLPYWLVLTGDGDPSTGTPDSEPGINGGLMRRMGGDPEDGQAVNAFVITVQVEDCQGAFDQALSLGGSVAMPVDAIPGVGWLAYFKDLDGNIVGLMQEDPGARPGSDGAPEQSTAN